MRKNNIEKIPTEEKIKEAARKVFQKKGYVATRTRDIAEEADVNLALLNYYFRSKEKLFDIIMTEILIGFFHTIGAVLNDNTSLEKKVALIANNYIDFLSKEENVPMFILSEIHNNPNKLLKKIKVKELILNSEFFKQYQDAVATGNITEPNVFHFLMNLMSMIVFPFVAQPLLQEISGLNNSQFKELMHERKKLIPFWIETMMTAK